MTKQTTSKKAQAENKNNGDVLSYYSSMRVGDVDKLLSSFGGVEWRDFSDVSKGKYPEFGALTFSVVANLPADTIKDAILILLSHQTKGKSPLKHELAKIAYYSSSNPNAPKATKTTSAKGRYTPAEIDALVEKGYITKEEAHNLIMGMG